VLEEHPIVDEAYVFFSASDASHNRRAASLGPGAFWTDDSVDAFEGRGRPTARASSVVPLRASGSVPRPAIPRQVSNSDRAALTPLTPQTSPLPVLPAPAYERIDPNPSRQVSFSDLPSVRPHSSRNSSGGSNVQFSNPFPSTPESQPLRRQTSSSSSSSSSVASATFVGTNEQSFLADTSDGVLRWNRHSDAAIAPSSSAARERTPSQEYPPADMSQSSPALSATHSNEGMGDGVSSAPVPSTCRSSFEMDRDAPVYQSSSSQRRMSSSSNTAPTSRNRSHTPKPAGRNHTNDRSDSSTRASSHKSSGLFNLHSISDALRGKSRPQSQSADERPKQGERSLSRSRASGLKAIRDALINGASLHEDAGEDSDDESNNRGRDQGWREFRAGTYSYPITVPVSVALPPSIRCDFGSVVYKIKASVQRAGALTPNLSAETEVQLIACPGEDDLEETDSIIVERFWETQLRYLVALSGKVSESFLYSKCFLPFLRSALRVFLLAVPSLFQFGSSEIL
jgi:hypothetical protein